MYLFISIALDWTILKMKTINHFVIIKLTHLEPRQPMLEIGQYIVNVDIILNVNLVAGPPVLAQCWINLVQNLFYF